MILQGREDIKQTSSAAKKVTFARDVIERIKDSIDEETTKELLSCGLHRRTMNTLERWKKEYAKVNDVDKFLEIKRQNFLAKWGAKSKKLKEWILKHLSKIRKIEAYPNVFNYLLSRSIYIFKRFSRLS